MRYTAIDGAAVVGEVWSPGPVVDSVWLTTGVCVAWRKALLGRRPREAGWYEITPPPLDPRGMWRPTSGRQAQYHRLAARHAPKISGSIWRRAIDE